MKLITILIILSITTPAFADLDCRVETKDVLCVESYPELANKGILLTVGRYVIVPLVETATEAIINLVYKAYIAKYGEDPGKIRVRK